jgi:hypothetical protein
VTKNGVYPFVSQTPAQAVTRSPQTGYRQVLRCRLHVEEGETSKTIDRSTGLPMPLKGQHKHRKQHKQLKQQSHARRADYRSFSLLVCRAAVRS